MSKEMKHSTSSHGRGSPHRGSGAGPATRTSKGGPEAASRAPGPAPDPQTSQLTVDHDEIRAWVEARGGRPAQVRGTGKEGQGLLRIDFPDHGSEGSLEGISWEEFFHRFEEKQLAFLYQEKTAEGKESRFAKLVSRRN